MKYLITLNEFYTLSAFLNHQLSGKAIDWWAIVTLIYGDKQEPDNIGYLLDALHYLEEAYGQQKRRLGPLAILHPIRSASLLVKASNNPTPLDLLTILLHDKNEDITENKYTTDNWKKLELIYEALIKKIDTVEKWFLNERIQFLTRDKDESYYDYINCLIMQARTTPELIRVKLADRMDNSLDLRMDIYEDTSSVDSYQVIFDSLFVETYKGPVVRKAFHSNREIKGDKRLYELFKNAVFLSLLRSEKILLDAPSKLLFNSLAGASINEAKNILLHIFSYHIENPQDHRDLLLDVMNYCREGGLRSVNIDNKHRLDGLFIKYFDHRDKIQLKIRLKELYRDKILMGEAAVAFAAIFSNFLNDDNFAIEGITPEGIKPKNLRNG